MILHCHSSVNGLSAACSLGHNDIALSLSKAQLKCVVLSQRLEPSSLSDTCVPLGKESQTFNARAGVYYLLSWQRQVIDNQPPPPSPSLTDKQPTYLLCMFCRCRRHRFHHHHHSSLYLLLMLISEEVGGGD